MKHTLLALHAQTAIHAGTGATDSVIDLPVQREAHTGYPCIFGSSVKGALRCKADAQVNKDMVTVLFGAKDATDNKNGNAGALLVSDARILLLPVRSLTGVFRWVTCPAVLSRFRQDAKRFNAKLDFPVPQVASGKVATCDEGNAPLYLEEYRLEQQDGTIDEALITALASTLNYDDSTAMLRRQLAVLSDDDFAYLAKYTLPVDAHIAIQEGTKIVKDGALWYEETLPSDTVLYIGVAAAESRQANKDARQSDTQVLADFSGLFNGENPWLQIGGNETTGMGWCHVTLLSKEEG